MPLAQIPVYQAQPVAATPYLPPSSKTSFTSPLPLLPLLFLLLRSATSSRAWAQADLTGSWNGFFHEDQPERVNGPEIGDYLGLPITAAARTSIPSSRKRPTVTTSTR